MSNRVLTGIEPETKVLLDGILHIAGDAVGDGRIYRDFKTGDERYLTGSQQSHMAAEIRLVLDDLPEDLIEKIARAREAPRSRSSASSTARSRCKDCVTCVPSTSSPNASAAEGSTSGKSSRKCSTNCVRKPRPRSRRTCQRTGKASRRRSRRPYATS